MTHQNIPGIYNYCDRWCERCTFTSRCAVYQPEADLTPDERDITNKAFWDRIGANFAKAQELIKKAAAEHGIDLNAIQEESKESIRLEQQLSDESRNHPLAVLALQYSEIGRDWLKTQPGMLDHLETLKTELNLGVASEEGARQETRIISESIAVIQWYLVLIYSKISRALMGKVTNYDWDEDENSQRDHDGSAKVAIIGVERSIHAWSALFEILPEHEDHFLKILSMLERIKTMTMNVFPGAMAFVRPGFDD